MRGRSVLLVAIAGCMSPEPSGLEGAAREFGVPGEILAAIARVETSDQLVDGVGVMALRGDRLARAATLANVDPAEVISDRDAGLRAAAALLAACAGDDGWPAAVARFSGLDGPAAAVYVDEVFGRAPSSRTTAAPDYPPAVWRPSPNHEPRPAGEEVMIIIHTCEGNYAGCWGWLTSPASRVSAHYVVNGNGSEISQLVEEDARAWHISAAYDCKLNGDVECARNGTPSNDFTIGIEHAGYAKQTSWDPGLIDASARLVCDISKRRGIPRDRFHIVAHGKLQPWDRTDPGPGWPWPAYLDKINAFCAPPVIVVDSNNARNDAALARLEVSASWISSAARPGYWGTGYRFAATTGPGAPADGASFWFHLERGETRTVDAWWTAAGKRSTAAPVRAFDAAGVALAARSVDQTQHGSQWNELGSWRFSAGWNRVVIGRDAPTGAFVIADAVRVR